MTRLVDFVDQPKALDPAVVEVYDFPSAKDTVKRMAREVIAPTTAEVVSEEPDPEDETLWEIAAASEAPTRPKANVSAAFDQGARLRQPELPDNDVVDPALKRPAARKRAAAGGRPPGSDQFTDVAAAGMIVLISFSLGEEFQPTEEEAKDLARPLGNILARRIDLAKKLGQDANDVVAFAVAMMAYTARVGPIAVEKVRESYNDRQHRTRVGRIIEPANGGGTDRMVAREDAGVSPSTGPAHNPFDAIAQAREHGLGQLDRDLGYAPGSRPPLADNGRF